MFKKNRHFYLFRLKMRGKMKEELDDFEEEEENFDDVISELDLDE